jgi:hypothetical protein
VNNQGISIFNSDQIGLLESCDFEHQPPGSILRDFDTLLNLVGDVGMPVTPSHLIAMGRLQTINSRLSHPIKLDNKRPVQKSYPLINGLYLVLRSTGLATIDCLAKNPVLKLDPTILASWRSLNAAERYFELLKAWWGRSRADIIGDQTGGYFDRCTFQLMDFLEWIRKSQGIVTITQPQEAERLKYRTSLHNVALMESFGFIKIQLMDSSMARSWSPREILLTEWGNAVLGSYLDFYYKNPKPDDGFTDKAMKLDLGEVLEPLECFERWSRSMRPHIRGWLRELCIPEPEFQAGIHVFNVSLGKGCWRRIALAGEEDFSIFAAVILDAFDFDNDHLHRFSFKDRFGRTQEIDHQYMSDSGNLLDNEVRIGEIQMHKGMAISFLFDFGDNWEFAIVVEEVNASPQIEKRNIMDEHGKAPAQYSD